MHNIKIAVIGLGYVGLPLARLFATKYPVVGFDINRSRVEELRAGKDHTLEVEPEVLRSVLIDYNPMEKGEGRRENGEGEKVRRGRLYEKEGEEMRNGDEEVTDATTSHLHTFTPSQVREERVGEDEEVRNATTSHLLTFSPSHLHDSGLYCTSDLEEIRECNFYVVTVPTPVDRNNRPDLTPLIRASETVGKVIKKGDIVVYESTVYPGATEEDCIPVIEKVSGLTFNTDFFAGYSPERINPGDKEHTVEKIKKVTSGSTPEAAERIDSAYRSVISVGTHKASSIRVAEAAKVIENSQRDINIAFVNELAKIFNRMGIDTADVLEAASTKWNFLPFRPGLVGGHCIGVDPYYLAQKAQEVGYHPEIILAGRRLNDTMGEYVASQVVKLMIRKGRCVKGARALILGITFKENCPDIRNTKVTDIYRELKNYGLEVDVFDPWAKAGEVMREYGISMLSGNPPEHQYSAIVLAVAHKEFRQLDLGKFKSADCVIYDVKGMLDRAMVDERL